MKPKLFIGSSVEVIKVAENIKIKLDYEFDIDLWNEGVFSIGNTTIDDLLTKLDQCDFGIFVFSVDDKSIIRNKEHSTVRDNVLYELGLYTGKLGRKNTFIIIPDNIPEDFHLPTDLIGINTGKYETSKINSNPESAVSIFCTKIKNQIFNAGKYPLSGSWEFTWKIEDSKNYAPTNTAKALLFEYENIIKFEYEVNADEKYKFIGKWDGKYYTGFWSNIKGKGYHGTFQFALNGKNNTFDGVWSGWGSSNVINSNSCTLKKI